MQYSELNIDQKINFKYNMQQKCIAYGTLQKGWYPMSMPDVCMLIGNVYAYDALYNWGSKYKGGYQIK